MTPYFDESRPLVKYYKIVEKNIFANIANLHQKKIKK